MRARLIMTSYPDKHRKRQGDKQTLLDVLMGNGVLCYKYYGIIENGTNTKLLVDIDDIKRPPHEDGFGITDFDRPYLDELLQMIQDEDGLIKIEEEKGEFHLTQKGINRCLELAIQQ
jgi:hypothetical protein